MGQDFLDMQYSSANLPVIGWVDLAPAAAVPGPPD